VTIRVKDNGIGIAAEHLPHLFDPFFRVKEERTSQIGGVGLGLAIVKHTVDAHAGAVRVESTIGMGTTVIIDLPLWSQP
jgi:signal transduction histidine kinase